MEKRSRLEVEREWCRTEFQDANLSMGTDSRWLADLAGHEFDEKWLAKINNDLVSIGSLELDEDNKDLYADIVLARYEFFDNVLGWSDETSMLYPIHEHFRTKEPYLLPLATVVERFRTIAASGKNAAHVLRHFPKLLTTDDHYFGVVMAHVNKASVESLEPVELAVRQPRVRKSPAERVPKVHIHKKVDVKDYHTSDEMEQLLKIFANFGIDTERVFALKGVGLASPVGVIESKLQGLEDVGLHPASVIKSYDDVLILNTEYIRDKIPVVRQYLDALNSDLPTTRFINEKPRILARSASRLLTVGAMFEGVTDLAGLPSRSVEPFARHSFHTGFATLIDKVKKGELVRAQDLERIGGILAVDERRSHNLESLRDTSICQMLSERAVRAYMTAQPLTEQERLAYPDLVNL